MSHIIQIGNSHGVRIPKAIIQQAGLMDVELVLKVVPEGLLITPVQKTRQGWASAFQAASVTNKQPQLIPHIENRFDDEEWEW